MIYLDFLQAGPCDPYFSDVILLLNNDQPDGSTTFIDSSTYANTITDTGDPVVAGGFAVFDGVDDSLQVAGSYPEFDIGSDDVTIEAIADLASLPSLWTVITNRSYPTPSPPDSGFLVIGNNLGLMQATVWAPPSGYSAVIAVNIVTSNGVISTGVHHICLQRNGNDWTLTVDGALVGSATSSAAMGIGVTDPIIGNDFSASGRWFHGGLKVRVTRGVARYTSFPFTPPTSFESHAC